MFNVVAAWSPECSSRASSCTWLDQGGQGPSFDQEEAIVKLLEASMFQN